MMENEKVIQTIEVNNKEQISLYQTFLEVNSKKRIFKKSIKYRYEDIETISLRISDEKTYVSSLGMFSSLNIKFKKRGMIGFEFYETDIKELKHHTAVVVAFVGSMKACISAFTEMVTETSFVTPLVEIIEPEVIDSDKSYQKMLETEASRMLLENKKNTNENQKLLK